MPADPLSLESPLFSWAQTYFRKGVHISVKMHRIEMTLCQKDVKLFSASIGHKHLVSKLNTWVHFEDYQKVSYMYRKLSLRTCDARWRSQPSYNNRNPALGVLWSCATGRPAQGCDYCIYSQPRPPSQEHKPVTTISTTYKIYVIVKS